MKRAEPPTLREVMRAVERELAEAGVESPGVETQRLLSAALRIDRPRLALEAGNPLPAEVAPRLARFLQRRLAGEPLQHIEGTAAFRSLDLGADPRALIPRPETEQLIDFVKRWSADRASGSGPVRVVPRPDAVRESPVRNALDIGTGSGAIALSLAAENIAVQVVGVDSSEAALEQAGENVRRAGLELRVELRKTGPNPFAALGASERFDVIVSNPPYVRDDELADLPVEIREFEPVEALSGGADGLGVIRRIAEQAAEFLEPDGCLWLEIGSGQAAEVQSIFLETGTWGHIQVHRDLAGRSRFVSAVPR